MKKEECIILTQEEYEDLLNAQKELNKTDKLIQQLFDTVDDNEKQEEIFKKLYYQMHFRNLEKLWFLK